MPPRIDELCEEDIGAVAAIDAAAFGLNATPDDLGEREKHLAEELRRPFSHVWVVRDESGIPVAFLVAWLVADEVHVLNVATLHSHRRRGAARSLLETVVRFARSKKARHVRLEVRKSNAAALGMYRAAGFFVVALRKSYYPDGEDAVDMDLRLDEDGSIVSMADQVSVDG